MSVATAVPRLEGCLLLPSIPPLVLPSHSSTASSSALAAVSAAAHETSLQLPGAGAPTTLVAATNSTANCSPRPPHAQDVALNLQGTAPFPAGSLGGNNSPTWSPRGAGSMQHGLARAMAKHLGASRLARLRWRKAVNALRGLLRAVRLAADDCNTFLAESEDAVANAAQGKGGVHLEVTSNKELAKLQYTQQGDATLYTDDMLQRRHALRSDKRVINIVREWWNWLPKDSAGPLSKLETSGPAIGRADAGAKSVLSKPVYMAMVVVLQLVLLPRFGLVGDKHYDPQEDWDHDSKGCETMDFPDFFDAMFELADMWCNTVAAADYEKLLRLLLEDVKASKRFQKLLNRFGYKPATFKRPISAPIQPPAPPPPQTPFSAPVVKVRPPRPTTAHMPVRPPENVSPRYLDVFRDQPPRKERPRSSRVAVKAVKTQAYMFNVRNPTGLEEDCECGAGEDELSQSADTVNRTSQPAAQITVLAADGRPSPGGSRTSSPSRNILGDNGISTSNNAGDGTLGYSRPQSVLSQVMIPSSPPLSPAQYSSPRGVAPWMHRPHSALRATASAGNSPRVYSEPDIDAAYQAVNGAYHDALAGLGARVVRPLSGCVSNTADCQGGYQSPIRPATAGGERPPLLWPSAARRSRSPSHIAGSPTPSYSTQAAGCNSMTRGNCISPQRASSMTEPDSAPASPIGNNSTTITTQRQRQDSPSRFGADSAQCASQLQPVPEQTNPPMDAAYTARQTFQRVPHVAQSPSRPCWSARERGEQSGRSATGSACGSPAAFPARSSFGRPLSSTATNRPASSGYRTRPQTAGVSGRSNCQPGGQHGGTRQQNNAFMLGRTPSPSIPPPHSACNSPRAVVLQPTRARSVSASHWGASLRVESTSGSMLFTRAAPLMLGPQSMREHFAGQFPAYVAAARLAAAAVVGGVT